MSRVVNTLLVGLMLAGLALAGCGEKENEGGKAKTGDNDKPAETDNGE